MPGASLSPTPPSALPFTCVNNSKQMTANGASGA